MAGYREIFVPGGAAGVDGGRLSGKGEGVAWRRVRP